MQRIGLRALSMVAFFVLLMVLGVPMPPPARAQSQAQPQAVPQWLSVTVVRIKPDMLTETLNLVKNETIPALQKGGVKWLATWETATFGEGYEYVFVTPIESLAQYDGETPIMKALGKEGAAAYLTKVRRLITSVHSYAVLLRPDLSDERQMTGPPKLAVVTVASVAPGRNSEFESFIKNDLLPVMKRAEVGGYWVHQTVLGGDANEYVTLALFDTFADIGKGNPVVRVLGQEAANKLIQKLAGVVVHAERVIARYNAELSFSPPAQAPAK